MEPKQSSGTPIRKYFYGTTVKELREKISLYGEEVRTGRDGGADVNQNKLKYGSYYNDLDLICSKEDGSFRSPQAVYRATKKLLEKLGLPDLRFHDLRHSFATAMLDLDVPLKVISNALGHSSISTTADIYCDVLEKKKTIADLVQNNFFPEQNKNDNAQ